MDGESDGASASAAKESGRKRRKWVRGTDAVLAEVCRRVASGETLLAIARDPAMPCAEMVNKWARTKPEFAAQLAAARVAAGWGGLGRPSGYCLETAQTICARVAEGEAITAICREPGMPVAATLYRWRAERTEFAVALACAVETRAEAYAERGWELAMAATPETAYLTHVRLQQLRWHVRHMAPRKYGPMKAAEAEGLALAPTGRKPGQVMHVYTKRFTCAEDAPDGVARWSEQPATWLSSTALGAGPDGEDVALPAPEVVREPRSTWGPGARGEARGGAVECEDEADDGAYWSLPEHGHIRDDEWT